MFSLSSSDVPPLRLQEDITNDPIITISTTGKVTAISASGVNYTGTIMFFYPILP